MRAGVRPLSSSMGSVLALTGGWAARRRARVLDLA